MTPSAPIPYNLHNDRTWCSYAVDNLHGACHGPVRSGRTSGMFHTACDHHHDMAVGEARKRELLAAKWLPGVPWPTTRQVLRSIADVAHLLAETPEDHERAKRAEHQAECDSNLFPGEALEHYEPMLAMRGWEVVKAEKECGR